MLKTSLWNDSGLACWFPRRKDSSLLSSDIFIEFWYLYWVSIPPARRMEGRNRHPKASDSVQFKQGLTLMIKREYFTKSPSSSQQTLAMECVKTKDYGLQIHCSMHYIITKIFQIGHPAQVHSYLNTLLLISRNNLLRWPDLLFG